MKKILLLGTFALCVLANAQTVTTFAGKANDNGFDNYESTSGVDLTNTYFSFPQGICFDHNGKMFISEQSKIRVVSNNKLYIRVGSLQSPTFSQGYKNGTGTQSTFSNPSGMVADGSGNIYVADKDNHCIRKISPFVNLGNGQTVTTFAGANPTPGLPGYGTSGSTNGTKTAARFNQPTDIARDAAGNMYVTEYLNFTVRKITPSGVVSTLAGLAESLGTADGTGSNARFGGPWGVAIYKDNFIVVADQWNTNIRKINTITGATTTLAGPTTGTVSKIVDGTLKDARFSAPKGIAVYNGIIYVADKNVIRAIDESNNSVTTIAGNSSAFSIKDGVGSAANFTELGDIEVSPTGDLYVTENSGAVSSHVIRKIVLNNLAPSANFTATKTSLLVDEKTTLSDISGGQAATSRQWTITPSSYNVSAGDLSASKDVTLSFSVASFYTVKLSITNDYGTHSTSSENYFAVSTTGDVKEYRNSNLLSIYPNPTNNEFQLKLDPSLNVSKTKISLYHINGSLVREIDAYSSVSTRELANGTYFVTLVNDDISIAKKLIVSHK